MKGNLLDYMPVKPLKRQVNVSRHFPKFLSYSVLKNI